MFTRTYLKINGAPLDRYQRRNMFQNLDDSLGTKGLKHFMRADGSLEIQTHNNIDQQNLSKCFYIYTGAAV